MSACKEDGSDKCEPRRRAWREARSKPASSETPGGGGFEGTFRFAGPRSSEGRLRLTEHKKSGRQAVSADLAAILIAAENLLQQRP